MKDLHGEFKALWLAQGLPESFLSNIVFTGNPDGVVFSSFRLGVAASISIGLSGLSAAYLHFLRTGIEQKVTVDARHAVLAFHSEAYYTIDGSVPTGETWDSIAGLYRTADNGWVRIHTNFPHHRAGVLSVLSVLDTPDTPATKSAVQATISSWNAQDLEDACAARGMCVFRMRSLEEWDASPQGRALAAADAPVVDVREVGIGIGRTSGARAPIRGLASAHPPPQPQHPLSNIRVLDLSRVLAGPIAGRTLAAHGAQVLLVTSPRLPALPALDVETSLGKRTARVHLGARTGDGGDVGDGSGEEGDGREVLRQLVVGAGRDGGDQEEKEGGAETGREGGGGGGRGADVFLQAYRPGGLEAKGFGVHDVVNMKANKGGGGGDGGGDGGERGDGVVYASLCAWGWDGPWANRRGFDSLVQTATGFNHDEGVAAMLYEREMNQHGGSPIDENEASPKPLPMQALDHAAGYFLAFGVNAALARSFQTGGGSYEVRVSLAGVGRWVRALGRLSLHSFAAEGEGARSPALPKTAEDEEVVRLSVEWVERRGGRLREGTQTEMRTQMRTQMRTRMRTQMRRRMTALRHAAVLEKTPVREGILEGEGEGEGDESQGDWGAPLRLDADDPVWID